MRNGRTRGFTLLELLVAVGLLAVLATVAYRGLASILEAESQVAEQTQRWSGVAVLLEQLGRDLSLAVARPATDGAGRTLPALALAGSEIALTRFEDHDSGAGLRRVGYRLRDGTLEYLVWPAVDSAPGALPAINPVLEGVAGFQLRAHDASGATAAAAWPPGAAIAALPRAVEAQIVLAGGERLTRVFLVR
jgi:general secretion pathway protein J